MPPVAASAAALAAAMNTSDVSPAASAGAAHSASVVAAAPRPQAVATNQDHHQQPAEPAELNTRPAESAAVIGGQSHAHLGHDAEHAEFEQLQSTGLGLPPGIHGCAAAASSAEGSSIPEGTRVFSRDSKDCAGCHDSSSMEDVIGTLLEAGRIMDDIERTDSAAEEPARWAFGSRGS